MTDPPGGMDRRTVSVGPRVLSRGRGGVDVSAGRWDGPADGPLFVCVHGLGGSAVNWMLLAPLLARQGEVWAPDLAGFGLTPPSGRRATVSDNLDLLLGFVHTVADGRRVVLVGNSMGGLMSILAAGTAPELVEALVLVAPASPRPVTAPLDRHVATNFALMAVPGVGELWMDRRRRRLSPAAQVRDTIRLCTADPSGIDPTAIAALEDMVRRRRDLPYVSRAFMQASRSLLLLVGPNARTLWGNVDAITAPTLLLHGDLDRLVTKLGVAALAARRPDWTLRTYEDLGHVPMLEAPARVAGDILGWLPSAQAAGAAVRRG